MLYEATIMMKMSGAVFGQMRRKRMTMPSRQGEKSGLPEFDSESGGGGGGTPTDSYRLPYARAARMDNSLFQQGNKKVL
jgi:hypothetical protein